MSLLRLIPTALLFAAVNCIVINAASAQSFPNRPVRMVTGEAGGGADFIARILAQSMSGSMNGQQVIVDNRPGILIGELGAKAPPDGYTVVCYGSPLWLLPLMKKEPTYDLLRDYSAVALTVISINVLVVHPALPVKTVKDLIVLAKARPGELNYASGPPGAANHLAAELFKSMAHVNLVRVSYKGTGPSTSALLSGETQLTFSSASVVMPHIKSGRLRAIAVTSSKPSTVLPGLPTIAAAGVPGYESVQMLGLMVPAKTPAAVIERLNQETVRTLNKPDVKDRFFNSGYEVVASTPDEFTTKIKAEINSLGKLIKDLGISE